MLLWAEDHGPEGRAGEANAAAGHRRRLLEEVTGGQLSALGQASKLHPSLEKDRWQEMARDGKRWQEMAREHLRFSKFPRISCNFESMLIDLFKRMRKDVYFTAIYNELQKETKTGVGVNKTMEGSQHSQHIKHHDIKIDMC